MRMDVPNSLPPFPVSQYVYYGDFRYYYGYGNTPAEDFLENVSNAKEPAILVLGCGEIRSCFYTLWKNFRRGVKSRFDKVQFVLNDYCAAVLARDILFLLLCLQMPSDKEGKKKWVSAIWAIWFCHELFPDHEHVLDTALGSLLQYSKSSETWSSSDNPLCSLVHFTSPRTLHEVRQMWKMWHTKDIGVKSVKAVNDARKGHRHEKLGDYASQIELETLTSFIFPLHGDDIQEWSLKEAEINAYFKSGSAFAEDVFEGPNSVKKTSVNSTLYDRENGEYTLHYDLLPFRCFNHAFQFSQQQMKAAGMSKRAFEQLLVSDTAFKTYPLLANSIQQLAMWLSSSAAILLNSTKYMRGISFTFHCSDAIEFCQELQSPSHAVALKTVHIFDLIYSSNLIDHLAPPNLVLCAMPLLKSGGYLFTSTFMYKAHGPTLEDYIQFCFGLENKLLPVILGIRCINHEGIYASDVAVQRVPCETRNYLPLVASAGYSPRLLIWEKLAMHPLKVLLSETDFSITSALCSSVCMISRPKVYRTTKQIGTETAIKILQTFAKLLDEDVSSYHFWMPLCSLLQQQDELKHHLNALQSHAFLHGLHLHLTVSESTCPICKNVSLTDFLSQFCVEVSLPLSQRAPNFVGYIHSLSLERDVHEIDCIAGVRDGSKLKLYFYAPSSYLKNNFSLSSYLLGGPAPLNFELKYGNLAEHVTPSISFSFEQTESPCASNASSLGVVTRHCGDGDCFESVISFSEVKMSSEFLTGKQISPSEVELVYGRKSHRILYPYPVKYYEASTKISLQNKTISIALARKAHNFEDEAPLFLVNPEDQLSLPPMSISDEATSRLCALQYTKQDNERRDQCRRIHELMPPMLNVKESFTIIFMLQDEYFLEFKTPNVVGLRGLLLINNRLFDPQCKTPVIDLSFCFVDTRLDGTVGLLLQWLKVRPNTTIRQILVDDAEMKILMKIFSYFAKCTTSSCIGKASSRIRLLAVHSIDQFFTRAVIYPLYADLDYQAPSCVDKFQVCPSVNKPQNLEQTGSQETKSTSSKCTFCGNQAENLKKCTQCKNAQYCGKSCQSKHWTQHKFECQNFKEPESPPQDSTQSTEHQYNEQLHSSLTCQTAKLQLPEDRKLAAKGSSERCSYCDVEGFVLKKCSKCRKVQYCGLECQKKHWKEHKSYCCSGAQGKSSDTKTGPTIFVPSKEMQASGNPQFCISKSSQMMKASPPKGSQVACAAGFTEKCSYCNKETPALKKCSKCHKEQYCGLKCQRAHWVEHKLHCSAPHQTATAEKYYKETEYHKRHLIENPKMQQAQDQGLLIQDCSDPHATKQTEQDFSFPVVADTKCNFCGMDSETLMRCSRCHKAQYCGNECRKKHWKKHRHECLKAEVDPLAISGIQDIAHDCSKDTYCKVGHEVNPVAPQAAAELKTQQMSAPSDLKSMPSIGPQFPIARYIYDHEHRHYYGYGNTPAEDFLENVSKTKEPAILVLGCGDFRSCFYTLWKNFSNKQECRFDKVQFVLNDYCAAIFARDILFLLLCLQMPSDKEGKKKWVSAIWAIWFCHELFPDHERILDTALGSLLQYSKSSETWSSSDNPLCSLVHFTSPRTLHEVRQMWKMWHTRDIGVNSVEKMNFHRKAKQAAMCVPTSVTLHETVQHTMLNTFRIQQSQEVSEAKIKVMEAELLAYFDCGNAFAEVILADSISVAKTSINATFYDRSDGLYTFHYASLPYRCFHHSFLFSPHQAKVAGIKKATIKQFIVNNASFETHPFLANSVQQFALWLSSSADILTESVSGKSIPHVSFTFHCSDAIEFCQELQSPPHAANLQTEQTFNTIYSSNLIDHLAPPNLVLCAIPLLKPGGYLFTTTLSMYKLLASNLKNYVQTCFGFDSKLLPVILGIRCINHEGSGYASEVSVIPTPVETGNLFELNYFPYILIWEKVAMHSLKTSLSTADSAITDALYNSVRVASQLKQLRTVKEIGSETAIKILQTFANLCDADTSNYNFWAPLCTLLQNQESFRTSLIALQTHAILHGLHLHLTVSDSTCPICKNVHISEYLSEFCVAVNLPLHQQEPNFAIFLSKLFVSPYHHLAPKNADVLIDCVVGTKDEYKLKVHFYAPKSFAAESYEFILCSYAEPAGLRVIKHGKLGDNAIPEITYSFGMTNVPTAPDPPSSLGLVTSHTGDGDRFESVLSLSDNAMSAYLHSTQSPKISAEMVSLTEMKISVTMSEYSHRIRYPYPIKYDKLSIKISCKKKTIRVVAPREAYRFEDESPLFLVNPDNRAVLPAMHLRKEAVGNYSGMQFTKLDRSIKTKCNEEPSLMPAILNLKDSLHTLFVCQDETWFEFVSLKQQVIGLLIINKLVFDIQCKSPAVDLAFCFLEDSDSHIVVKQWLQIRPHYLRRITVDLVEYDLLKRVFAYFGKRTVSSGIQEATGYHFQLLTKYNVAQYYTRVVIYPLYPAGDIQAQTMNELMMSRSVQPPQPDSTGLQAALLAAAEEDGLSASMKYSVAEVCSFCGKQRPKKLRKCTGCGKVQYCGIECQKKHWIDHKKDCQKQKFQVGSQDRNTDPTETQDLPEPGEPSECYPS